MDPSAVLGEGAVEGGRQRPPRPCRFFARPEGCRNGESCRFVHEQAVVAQRVRDDGGDEGDARRRRGEDQAVVAQRRRGDDENRALAADQKDAPEEEATGDASTELWPLRIGLDCGGVLLQIGEGGSDTIFSQDYLRSPQEPGAFAGATEFSRLLEGGGKALFLVSKCGDKIAQRTVSWLHEQNFFSETGMPPENARFCHDRNGKGPIARELGLSVFVDDRLDCLEFVLGRDGVAEGPFLAVWYGPRANEKHVPRSLRPETGRTRLIVCVQSWDDVVSEVTAFVANGQRWQGRRR